MKSFNGGIELRLTKEDLIQLVEYVLNNRILGGMMDDHEVESISLHPDNKYVARITTKPKD